MNAAQYLLCSRRDLPGDRIRSRSKELLSTTYLRHGILESVLKPIQRHDIHHKNTTRADVCGMSWWCTVVFAWVEKQLACVAWCWNCYFLLQRLLRATTRPSKPSLDCAKDWKLHSLCYQVLRTIISSESHICNILPKTSFRMPSAWAKVVFYGHNRNAEQLGSLSSRLMPCRKSISSMDMGFVIEHPQSRWFRLRSMIESVVSWIKK